MPATFHVAVILDRPVPPGPAALADLESRFISVLVPPHAAPAVVLFIQVEDESLSRAIEQVISVVERVADARVKSVYGSSDGDSSLLGGGAVGGAVPLEHRQRTTGHDA